MDATDGIVEKILTTYDTITVVGASNATGKAAHYVPLHMQEHGWRIIAVNPHAEEILGEKVDRSLADVPGNVGLLYVQDRCLIIEQRRLGLNAPTPVPPPATT